jgi:apolipoprotein N-acyltransferase
MSKSWIASTWQMWLAAAVSACLLELPFPIAGPIQPWRSVFAWFGLVPLLWAILAPDPHNSPLPASHSTGLPSSGSPDPAPVRRPIRRAFLLAWFCGVLWYMGNCYWIYDTMHIHGGLPPAVSFLILLLFSLVLGGYFGLFGLGLARVHRATGSVRLALAFAPFLWVALELAGARITSVPWDQLGYSQVDNALVNQIAPWTGVYGISFVLVAANAFLAERWLTKRPSLWTRPRSEWLKLDLLAGVWMLIWFVGLCGFKVVPRSTPPTATAVLIQPNLDVENTGYWNGTAEWAQHIADFIHLGSENCKSFIAGLPQTSAPTSQIACPPNPTNPDLIVWPESPAPYFEQDPRFQQAMAEVARADQAPVIVNGVGSDFSATDHDWIDHVSAMVFNADGSELGRYDKIHLVPWGEYVPYPKIFFFARKLTGRVAHFTPGTVRSIFHLQTRNGETGMGLGTTDETANGEKGTIETHRYGIFICYESVFADEIRQFARNGAEVFVNVSDDGWYGDTSAPWQHLNMARMRAIENRRWILRATNDGVTASIDPYGRVRQSIPRHAVDALPAQYGFRSDITFYTAHGDVFAWLCAILSIGVAGWYIVRRKPR